MDRQDLLMVLLVHLESARQIGEDFLDDMNDQEFKIWMKAVQAPLVETLEKAKDIYALNA
jgi:hypothetical protein